MLSRGLTTILADMTLPEAIEIPSIHRVTVRTGACGVGDDAPGSRPHQTISDGGVIGGGHVPLPGEESLAPHGMGFRDARPECRRHRLEVLANRSRMVSYEGRPGL
jgi:magnesium chelatase family protein